MFDIGAFLSQALATLINPIFDILNWFILLIPKIPDFPNSVYLNFKAFLDYVFSSSGLGFVGWVFGGWTVPFLVVSIGFTISLARVGYLAVMFIISKLPIGVKR